MKGDVRVEHWSVSPQRGVAVGTWASHRKWGKMVHVHACVVMDGGEQHAALYSS